MNTYDLIISTDDRGRIGFRGAFSPLYSLTESEVAVAGAIDLGLIHLIAAWRSAEDARPGDAWTSQIDRRVYSLTDKGWAYKITGGTDHLQNYLVDVMADAELAHWGATDAAASTSLRFPESSFDGWENSLLVAGLGEAMGVPVITPKHQHHGDDLDWPAPTNVPLFWALVVPLAVATGLVVGLLYVWLT